MESEVRLVVHLPEFCEGIRCGQEIAFEQGGRGPLSGVWRPRRAVSRARPVSSEERCKERSLVVDEFDPDFARARRLERRIEKLLRAQPIVCPEAEKRGVHGDGPLCLGVGRLSCERE